jgi:hypothetical protein
MATGVRPARGGALAIAVSAAAIASAACGGGRAAPAPAPAGPAPCERVGDHLVGLLTAGLPAGSPDERPTATIDKLTRVVVELCAGGGWSADAQRCFLGIRSLAGDAAAWDRCAGELTVEQRDALPRAIDAAFGPRQGP